jgi:3-oxoacyl-[acyl-carrier protein] reductase
MKKTVLITGASRGIGRETAKLFASKGYNVVINYLNSEKLAKELVKELEQSAIAIKADVSDIESVDNMFKSAKEVFGNIDILINNAGIALGELFTKTSRQEFDRIFDVNIGGIFNCCKAVIPDMIKNHKGKIINVSSIWGICGASCEVIYSASKAAVIGFTKALAKELGPSGININCIAPGIIDTDMNSDLDKEVLEALEDKTPLQRIGSALDIANAILFLASNESDFITGQVISPNGGFVI